MTEREKQFLFLIYFFVTTSATSILSDNPTNGLLGGIWLMLVYPHFISLLVYLWSKDQPDVTKPGGGL
jgi:hypothetical protein